MTVVTLSKNNGHKVTRGHKVLHCSRTAPTDPPSLAQSSTPEPEAEEKSSRAMYNNPLCPSRGQPESAGWTGLAISFLFYYYDE